MRCERYAAQQATPDRLALLAFCRLARAEVGRAAGDSKAESLAQQALEVMRRLRSEPAQMAAALYAAGAARVERGEGGEALKVLREADTLLGRAYPKGTPAQAVVAMGLAASYQQLGEKESSLAQVADRNACGTSYSPRRASRTATRS